MTAKELKEKEGDRFHEVMGWWNSGVNQAKLGYLLMGKSIYFIKKEKLWKKEIEHMPTFKYWAEHALHISVAQADRLAQIYFELGHLLENIPFDISKVTLLLPYLRDKDDAEKKEILFMANECTVEDIKNNLKELKGEGTATDVCTHPESEIEYVPRCKACGKWIK